MLTLSFWGADGLMITPETLTSGMVGAKIAFQFSEDWEGLNKTAVFMAGNTIRAVSNIEDAAEIPAEVLAAPGSRLYVGIYGESEDGTLVIPTICVAGPKIQYGADPLQAPAGEPPVTSYARLLTMIGDLAELKTEAKDSLVAALNEMFSNGSNGSSADTGGNSGSDSSQNATGGMSATAAALLITIFRNAVYSTDQSANITALEAALASSDSGSGDSSGDSGSGDDSGETEVTLSSISATYSGGDVTAGTAVSDLTGIVVTAHYSDGSTETVTDYTLSGTIAEGSNVVTVVYGGKATTFTVTGIAETAVEYGLHHDSGYAGNLMTGLTTTTTALINLSKIVFDIDYKTTTLTSNVVLFMYDGLAAWGGINTSGNWTFQNSTEKISADKEPSEIMGTGRTTVTLEVSGVQETNCGDWIILAGNGTYTPEITWYGARFYSGDSLIADLKPTANVGEMYDSVSGETFTFSVTDGLTLVEV